jgi:calmodulin
MALPQNMVRDLEEAFFLFDYDKDGKITTKEVGAAVRSVGLNPTQLELKDMNNDVDGLGGTVDVQNLTQIISKRVRNFTTTPEELRDAFMVFDKQGTGQVSVHDLKMSLTTLGERLTDEELDELIREVDQDGEGMVRADDVVKVLLV